MVFGLRSYPAGISKLEGNEALCQKHSSEGTSKKGVTDDRLSVLDGRKALNLKDRIKNDLVEDIISFPPKTIQQCRRGSRNSFGGHQVINVYT